MTDIETKNIILPPNGSFLSGNLTLSNYEQILERENSNLKNRINDSFQTMTMPVPSG